MRLDSLHRLTRLGWRALGASLVQLIGIDDHSLHVWASFGDAQPHLSRDLERLARSTASADHGVILSQTEDGSDADADSMSLAGVPVRNGQGRVAAALCVVVAVARGWTAEDAQTLKDLAAAMRDELGQSEAPCALPDAQSLDLEQMDAFLGTVSHDLRTPITTIRGHAQMLGRRALRLDDPDAPRFVAGLGSIDAATRQMVQMLDELLESAATDADALDANRRPADLIALARSAVDESQERTVIHEIRLVTSSSELLAPIHAERICRLLVHLLDNAIRYSPAGGPITVVIERSSSGDQSWADLTIQDRGLGIPVDDLPHVFERYRRGSNVATIHGTGLGLTNAQRIVQQHGGTMNIESVLDHGTLVSVRLPLGSDD